MARFFLVPDERDAPERGQLDLFADARDVMSVPQAAEQLGVCPQTVRRLIARGELDAVHVGRAVRVPKTALVRFVVDQIGG